MNGVDTLLMTDWEIWITLIILGAAGATLVPLTPGFARPHRGRAIAMAAAAAIAGAALLASYSLAPVHATAELVADTGRG